MKTYKLFKTVLLLVALVGGVSVSWADPVTLASWSSSTSTEYTNNGSGYYTPSEGTRSALQVAYSTRIYLYPSTYVGTQSDYKLSFYSSNTSNQCGFYNTNEDKFWMKLSDNNIDDFTNREKHDNYVEVSFPATGYKNVTFHAQAAGFSNNSGKYHIVVSPDGGTTWFYGGEYTSTNHYNTLGEDVNISLAVSNCANVIVRMIVGNDKIGRNDWRVANVSITGEMISSGEIANIRTLTISKNYYSAGEVKVSPVGNQFVDDTNVSLQANANTDYSFVKWTNGGETVLGTETTLNQRMSSDLTVKAIFAGNTALPIYGTSVLDLSKGSMTSSSNPRYSTSEPGTNNEISYIKNGYYADNFYVQISGDETAYYDLRATISGHNQGGTFKITITDIETATDEVDKQESVAITSNGQIIMPLTGMLSPGLKKIRLDFVNTSATGYLYNIKDICFNKRSLNEAYDYAPVAATGVDVVLTRSITADKWATIVLPFDMTSDQITSAFGANAKVAQLTGFSADKLQFTTATSMNAHEPYLIQVASGDSYSGTATINGVTITTGTPSKTSVSGVDFIGSYNALTDIPYSDASYAYYFISSNTLYQTETSGTHDTMKGFRAYFKVPGTTAARALSFSIDDEGGETTSIAEVRGKMSDVRGEYFDLQGRKVAQPGKGLYIVNGKKVIIK